MTLIDKEKEMITQSLKGFQKLEGFEKLLESPLPFQFDVLMPWNSVKGAHASEKFRKEGNQLFRQKNHDVCVHYSIISKYNQSIAMSPFNSEALALGYGNRSSILEHIGKYKESITAIDRAVKVTMTPALLVKLHCRKAKCMAALGLPDADDNVQVAKLWLGKIYPGEQGYESLTDFLAKTETIVKDRLQNPVKTDDEREKSLKLLSKIKAESANTVSMAYSERYGRHLVANRDIKPGEILLMEKTVNTYPNLKHLHLYCWHCSSFLWDTVPCDTCILGSFCSEECKTEAWETYHEVECNILSTLFINYNYLSNSCRPFIEGETSALNLIGLRILLTALKQAGSVRNLRAALESFDEREDKEQIFRDLPENDYRQVYALPCNMRASDLAHIVKDSALQLIILAKFTTIFKDIFDSRDFSVEKLLSNDDMLFVGALLLKFCANAHSYSIKNERTPDCKKTKPCGDFGCGRISRSFGVKTSFTRRSCIPNAKRCMISSNQMILYSIMPIKKGAQIFDSSVSIFDDAPNLELKLARQEYFQECHGYPCDCRACKEDWPLIVSEDDSLDHYLEVAPSFPYRRFKIFNSFIEALKGTSIRKEASSTMEMMSKFSKVIEDSLEESPLPSRFPAFLIQGFASLMTVSRAFPNMPQITDECLN